MLEKLRKMYERLSNMSPSDVVSMLDKHKPTQETIDSYAFLEKHVLKLGLDQINKISQQPEELTMQTVPELIEAILEFALTDEKDIIGKALKLSEETGEVAEAILAVQGWKPHYEGCPRTEALKEIADVVICAVSLLPHLGYTQGDLQGAMSEKIIAWKRKTDAANCNPEPPTELRSDILHPGDAVTATRTISKTGKFLEALDEIPSTSFAPNIMPPNWRKHD